MRLGDVFRLSSGKSLPEKKRVSGNYSVYGGNGITGYHNEFFIKEPTIVIGRVGEYCGSVHLTSDNCWVTDNALMVTDWYIDVDKEYLVYALKFLNLHQYAKISGQPSISQGNIYGLNIEMPSKEHQKEIVAILKKTESLIQYRYKQIFQLDNLIKARFVEMFGDYQTNSKGFETHAGNELFKFSSGKSLPKEKRLEDGVPVYGGNGIAWYTDECLIDYPTVIIGRVGAGCGNIHTVLEPVWITDNAIYIKEQKTDKFTLEFLTELMKVMDFHQYADFSGQPKITQKPLESLSYLMPPVDMQNEFTDFVKQIDKSKVAVQKSLDETQMLFDSLMQKYFG